MALARSPSVPSGNPDKSRADKPFVVGITRENHLGDGSGLELAAVHLEYGLVLVGIERRAGFGFDASDTVLCERVLQSAFAGGNRQLRHAASYNFCDGYKRNYLFDKIRPNQITNAARSRCSIRLLFLPRTACATRKSRRISISNFSRRNPTL